MTALTALTLLARVDRERVPLRNEGLIWDNLAGVTYLSAMRISQAPINVSRANLQCAMFGKGMTGQSIHNVRCKRAHGMRALTNARLSLDFHKPFCFDALQYSTAGHRFTKHGAPHGITNKSLSTVSRDIDF